MKASIVDLRYKMKEVLKALDKNEEVSIIYHGKEKGKIIPNVNKTELSVKDHPFFGMNANKNISVEDEMQNIRGGRYNDI